MSDLDIRDFPRSQDPIYIQFKVSKIQQELLMGTSHHEIKRKGKVEMRKSRNNKEIKDTV